MWRTWPADTAAAAHPVTPAPTARRGSTGAAATPVLMVRTACSSPQLLFMSLCSDFTKKASGLQSRFLLLSGEGICCSLR